MDYRIYKIEAGRIIDVHDIGAADDQDAVDKAAANAEGHIIELWQGQRLVGRMNDIAQAKGNLASTHEVGRA